MAIQKRINFWSINCFLITVCFGIALCVPTIQWFTPRLFPHLPQNQTVIKCGFEQFSCLTSIENNMNDKPFDAIIFYGSDLDIELKSLPIRDNISKWALLHEESPLNNYRLALKQVLNSFFDITATFQRNSSFPLTTQFLKSLRYLTSDRHMLTVEQKNFMKKQNGLASVVYVQSNCDVPSDRDRYVSQLIKYIDIDSYGQCLNNKRFETDSKLDSSEYFDSQEFYQFISQYKFMITFENAICDDYISEKLWRSLHLGIIPIYRGSPSVTDWLPNNSTAIIVDEELEKNPSKLAQIIINLDKNDSQYNDYLLWKKISIQETNIHLYNILKNRKWTVSEDSDNDFIRGFECYVCEVLHGKHNNVKIDLKGCPKPIPALGLSESQLNFSDKWLFWEYEWNEAINFENIFFSRDIKQEL